MDLDIKIVKKDFYHSSKLGWYYMVQLNVKGEDFFLCQQLPPKVTGGWERWIPVTERLPELHTKVLCCGIRGGRFIAELTTWGNGNKIWDKRTGKGCPEVTHWTPLPDAPKEDE